MNNTQQKMHTVIRAVLLLSGEFVRWVEVGPAESIEDAKRRYSPLQYGYAVILK